MSGESRRHAPATDTTTAAPASPGGPEINLRDDEPPVRCPYCDRPFQRAELESLHRGLEHPDRLSDRERAAVERAAREERVELRRFRIYALGVLVVLYFGLLIIAAFVV
ncbi:hypothetical protein [Natrinema sp. SYSU A 869]|uniref:DUF7410 domain-containing protein n=1 Tax=Natrinema sp. SYSU A 869 TaxID=2871694 RepID=UPI0021056FCA|nr:hypothetical protein [Natrinema sp. SYSU A 869]